MVLSLDGFATSPDGTHEWMFEFFGADSGEWTLAALQESGTHLMGRRSDEIMGPHWQASEGPVASSMNGKPKAVLSRKATSGEWGPAEFFADPGAAIAELRNREEEGTILVHGGPTLAASVVARGLVDEFQLTWVPVAIGAGRGPFAGLDRHLKLDLVREQRFASGAHGQVLVPKR